jgi:hypothetical protein
MLWFEPRGSVRSLLQLTTTPAWCIHRRSQAGAVERIRRIDSWRSTTDRPESRPLPRVRISACSSVSTFQQPSWQRQALPAGRTPLHADRLCRLLPGRQRPSGISLPSGTQGWVLSRPDHSANPPTSTGSEHGQTVSTGAGPLCILHFYIF